MRTPSVRSLPGYLYLFLISVCYSLFWAETSCVFTTSPIYGSGITDASPPRGHPSHACLCYLRPLPYTYVFPCPRPTRVDTDATRTTQNSTTTALTSSRAGGMATWGSSARSCEASPQPHWNHICATLLKKGPLFTPISASLVPARHGTLGLPGEPWAGTAR